MKPSHTSLLVALAAAAFLVGCGGGGDETTESAPATTETTAVTQAELLERGDAICAEVNAAVGTIGASSSETGNPAEQAAGLYSGMVDSLKGIGAPQETEGYPEFIAAAEALATAEDEVELASERGDTAALESAEANASSALASFQSAADEYGFEECSEGPSAPVSAGTAPESGETGSAEAPGEPEEAVEPEVEAEPEPAPETGGAGGGVEEGGGTTGAPEGGGETGGSSGGVGPG